MSTKIDNKKIFYIDSNNRTGGTTSDFTVTLNIQPGDEFTHAVVLQCLIPKSYYLVQSGSNTFQLQEDIFNVVITVPVGNYSRRSFQSAIISLLNSNSPNLWVYSITYPNTATAADTGLFTYIVTGNSVQPIFKFPASSTLYEQFGFNKGSTNSFQGNQLVSANVLKMVREDAIYLRSDIIQSMEGNSVLQCVFSSSDSPAYSNIAYRAIDVEANSKEMVASTGNIYRFYLTNEDEVPINLNGLNFIISLMLYKQNNLSSLLKGAIKYFTLKS
jgi:hypothetical protein